MLLVVNSLPKCGSTWFSELVFRCLETLGHPRASAHITVNPWGNPGPLTGKNNPWGNPGPLTGKNLNTILDITESVTFAVKAHESPHSDLRKALQIGRARMIFIQRDTESIIASALAYGARLRQINMVDGPYKEIRSEKEAREFVEPFLEWKAAWKSAGAQVYDYDDLFSSDSEVQNAVSYLHPPLKFVVREQPGKMQPNILTQEERDQLRVVRAF